MEDLKLEYFGTNLSEHGHYRWELSEHSFLSRGLRFNDLPFDPEQLTKTLQKGETAFYQGGGFTAIAISGSPIDERGGTKSVFWVKAVITKDELIKIIIDNKIAAQILYKMPFGVKW